MEKRTKQQIISGNDKILEMIKSSPRVWISTDWHYVKYDKQTKKIHVREEFDDIMKACSVIKPGDTWIYLGDLIDSEIQTTSHLDVIQRHVNTDKRALLLGNNDRFKSYSNWFDVVACTIMLPEDNAILTHCPIMNYEKLNIHGHIHVGEPGYAKAGMYWDMYDIIPENHVNAFTYPFKPVLLSQLLKRKPKSFHQHADIKGKPYTADLIKNTVYEYDVLRAYYLKKGMIKDA